MHHCIPPHLLLLSGLQTTASENPASLDIHGPNHPFGWPCRRPMSSIPTPVNSVVLYALFPCTSHSNCQNMSVIFHATRNVPLNGVFAYFMAPLFITTFPGLSQQIKAPTRGTGDVRQLWMCQSGWWCASPSPPRQSPVVVRPLTHPLYSMPCPAMHPSPYCWLCPTLWVPPVSDYWPTVVKSGRNKRDQLARSITKVCQSC